MLQCNTLELLDSYKHFNLVVVIGRVNIRIPGGLTVGIIGRSGAGKSTLLWIVNRLSDPSPGRIQYGTTVVSSPKGPRLREVRAKAAMIFQQFNIVDRFDVMTNVLYFFESNTRSATIPGIVGAGGIGLHLSDRIRVNNGDEVTFILCLILITVYVIDLFFRSIHMCLIVPKVATQHRSNR